MKDCSKCKYGDVDYLTDEDGEEYPFYTCEKGKDTDLDFECEEFKEYKPKRYVEKDTECDKCEHLKECKQNYYIDCTTVNDTRSHIMCDMRKCKKRG